MDPVEPKNAAEVRKVVEDRLAAISGGPGTEETETVGWRGQPKHLPVISMPIDLLSYNPGTHRIRAQRSLDAVKDRDLDADPFGVAAQAYLHHLLMGDPADPSKVDPGFDDLKKDLQQHGQNAPGIITRTGVLINGNTRRAALKELGQAHMRVGVLPPDAGHDDLVSIEFSLQLRKTHHRDYSFMNFLLAVEEQALSGLPPAEIQKYFRIQATTYERACWILGFVREAIERSRVEGPDGTDLSLRLIDFEQHQGKLEELYRSYTSLKVKSPDGAEGLREQRLFAIVFNKSKTDLRLIEPDFARKFMKGVLPAEPTSGGGGVTIPGTSITAPGPSADVEALRDLTTEALKARAVLLGSTSVAPEEAQRAAETLAELGSSLDKALDQAGKHGRVIKRRLAAADRLGDARDDLEMAVAAVAEARSTGNFNPDDLDEVLTEIRAYLLKLAQLVARSDAGDGDGLDWLRSVGSLQAE